MPACGTNTAYQAGCRCDDCRCARREYQRGYRKNGADLYQLPVGVPPGPWFDQAKCKGLDTDWFFPEVGGRGVPEAARFCAGCPVRIDCLDYALTNRIEHGIWGGFSARDRKTLRRKGAA